MTKVKQILLIGICIVLISCSVQEPYTQEELSDIYDNCDGVPNNYFFDKDAYTYGVRCFNIDTAQSMIYGDCEKIFEYHKQEGDYSKRLYECVDKRGIRERELMKVDSFDKLMKRCEKAEIYFFVSMLIILLLMIFAFLIIITIQSGRIDEK